MIIITFSSLFHNRNYDAKDICKCICNRYHHITLSDIFPFQFTQSSHFAQLHFLSACFCNQHPVNLFLHGFLCLFVEIITDNIYCLPDLLCKCVSFCFCIHHFLHNHLFPFFPVPDRERIVFVPAGSLSVRWQRKCQHRVWNFLLVVFLFSKILLKSFLNVLVDTC